MGWGDPPHEGYTARRLTAQAAAHNDYPDQGDRRWTAAFSNATRGTEGWESRCTCGWRSGRFHPNDDPQRDFEPEGVGDRVWAEWRDTHIAPLVDPEANRVLVLSTDAGGWRHFLDGQPVHAGSQLELRLADDLWVPVRYEWSWVRARPPRAYLSLGGRGERIGPEWAPDPISFALPARAELRWPTDDGRGERGSGDGRRLLRGPQQAVLADQTVAQDDRPPGAPRRPRSGG